ncbi:hypothetical protein pdam_00019899, partial [Pocillopora damicornis]
KLTASAKTSEPPVEPTTTEPELNIASTDEKATKTYLPTIDQSSAPHKSHPEVVTVSEQTICGSSVFQKTYSEIKNYKKKSELHRFAYTSFKKVLVDLRSFTRGKSYDNQDDLTQLRVLDDIL